MNTSITRNGNARQELIDAGYDIVSEAEKLQRWYLNLYDTVSKEINMKIDNDWTQKNTWKRRWNRSCVGRIDNKDGKKKEMKWSHIIDIKKVLNVPKNIKVCKL